MIETGYYAQKELSIDNFLELIKNPLWEENIDTMEEMYNNAQVFFNGSCHLFAYALNTIYGYNIIESRSLICEAQCHYFCSTNIEDQILYLDVRGATTNRDEFFRGLGYKNEKEYKLITHSQIELDRDLFEDGAKFGYNFAKYIIQTCPQYYDLHVTKGG